MRLFGTHFDPCIVHVALPFEFLFLAKLLGQATFHLAEAQIVHFCGINVGRGYPRTEQARQRDCVLGPAIGVVGRVYREQNLPVPRQRSGFGIG